MPNGIVTLEDNLAVPYKATQNLTIKPSNHIPRYLLNCVGKMSIPKPSHECLQQLLLIWPQTESNQMSFNRWMDKLWYIQTIGYYSEIKRNKPSNHKKLWRKLKWILLIEKIKWQSGKGKTIHMKKNSICWNFRRRREKWIGEARSIFRMEKLFCMVLEWWIYNILHLSNLWNLTTPRINLMHAN